MKVYLFLSGIHICQKSHYALLNTTHYIGSKWSQVHRPNYVVNGDPEWPVCKKMSDYSPPIGLYAYVADHILLELKIQWLS